MASPGRHARRRQSSITGGAGFIGSNLADSFLRDGDEVIVVDNFSAPGLEHNLLWLKERHGPRVHSHPLRRARRDAIERRRWRMRRRSSTWRRRSR
jgi:CDP-paratose 2-epimerase